MNILISLLVAQKNDGSLSIILEGNGLLAVMDEETPSKVIKIVEVGTKQPENSQKFPFLTRAYDSQNNSGIIGTSLLLRRLIKTWKLAKRWQFT